MFSFRSEKGKELTRSDWTSRLMSINSDYAEPCRTGDPRIAVLMCYLADAGLCGALDVPDLELEKPSSSLLGRAG